MPSPRSTYRSDQCSDQRSNHRAAQCSTHRPIHRSTHRFTHRSTRRSTKTVTVCQNEDSRPIVAIDNNAGASFLIYKFDIKKQNLSTFRMTTTVRALCIRCRPNYRPESSKA